MVDFRTRAGPIDDGYLDFFDIPFIVGELNDAFGIEISSVDITLENLDSVQALWGMVGRPRGSWGGMSCPFF